MKLRTLYISIIILVFARSTVSGSTAKSAVSGSAPQWKDHFVTIYSDASSIRFGVARQRIALTNNVYKFKYGYSLPVHGEEGFLTAVTASKQFKDNLETLLKTHRSISLEGRTILRITHDNAKKSLIHNMYVYQEEERGIYIGFTLEKPTQEIFDLIDNVYTEYPATAEIVKRHYRNNYIIRIIQADNFHSHQDPPSILDIMFSATLIGEKEQPLYGIHDGQDYLSSLPELLKKSPDYKILVDDYNPLIKSGGA